MSKSGVHDSSVEIQYVTLVKAIHFQIILKIGVIPVSRLST